MGCSNVGLTPRNYQHPIFILYDYSYAIINIKYVGHIALLILVFISDWYEYAGGE